MKIFILFFIILTIVFGYEFYSGSPNRIPAGVDGTNIELVKWKFNERVNFVVLGVSDPLNRGAEQDMSSIPYPILYQTTDRLVPKFLLTFVDDKIKEIYSFELKKKRIKPLDAMESDQVKRWYLKIDKDEEYYPKKLVDIDDVRKDSLFMAIIKLANTGILFTDLAPVGILLNRIINVIEEKKSYQASYLERLVRFELFENKIPELREVLGSENLWTIGASLNLRFHSESDFAAFFTSKRRMIELYKKYRQLKEDEYYITMSKLVQRTNEEGLLTIPLTSDFAIVYAFKNEEYYENFSSFLLNIQNPKELISSIENMDLNLNELIPLGIFSTRETRTPLTVVDFNNVGWNTKKNEWVRVLESAKEIGFNYLSFSGLSIGLRAVDGLIHFVNVKTGSTIFEHRIYSDAEFDLLVDTGIFEVSSENILREALDKQLENIKVDKLERKKLVGDLNSNNKSEQEVAMTGIIKKFVDKEKEEKILDFEKPFKASTFRLKNWLAFKNFVNHSKKFMKLMSKLEQKSELKRIPASSKPHFEKPVVLLLIDGLRPDRLRAAAKKGLVPNLQSLFLQTGREFNSFTTRSLTLPSWGTIFTGHTPDQHGVRSNTPIDRSSARTKANYTDIRKDFHSIIKEGKNRSLVHLHESGIKWIGDYYDSDSVLMNYMPYSDGLNLPIKNLGSFALDHLSEIVYGAFNGALALDLSSIDRAIEKIEKNPGKHKLVMNWFASVDVKSHHNNESLDDVYMAIDKSIGKLVSTLKNDPILKDAHIFLISDHGMRGGVENENSTYKLLKKGELLKNTGFNLTTFFAGDYFSHNDFNFVVKTFESPTPDHDLHFLSEFQIHPFEYIYRGKANNQGPANLMVDTSGDALAQVYLSAPDNNWNERPSLYDLTNYKGKTKDINFIDELLNLKLLSVAISNPELRKILKGKDGYRPVEFFVTWLKEDNSIEQVKEKLGVSRKLTREPVIIFRDNGKGIIFSSRNKAGSEIFRYIPLKLIEQSIDGEVDIALGGEKEDVFGYYKNSNFSYNNWYTDRQLLSLFSESKYPNAVYGLVKLLTVDRNIASNSERQSERPDFVLMARPGFNFNSSYSTEGDHGSIEKVQVKHSLFMTKLGEKDQRTYKEPTVPVMAKDILPTILKINGVNEDSNLWKPFWHTLLK